MGSGGLCVELLVFCPGSFCLFWTGVWGGMLMVDGVLERVGIVLVHRCEACDGPGGH